MAAKAKAASSNGKGAKDKAPAKKSSILASAKTAVKAAAKLVKAATKSVPAPKKDAPKEAPKKAPEKVAEKVPAKVAAKTADKPAAKAAPVAPVAAPPAKATKGAEKPAAPAKAGKGGKASSAPPAKAAPKVEVQRPRATKLPPVGNPLTKREMEQLLTAGAGRGVLGEGSLKGKLVVKDGLPHLLVVGRDKRELDFVLQGPDQEVLPAYVEHKVSVTGLIKKLTNYGGSVDVRKYSAKKPEAEAAPEPAGPAEEKLRFLNPGEIEQITNAGMGAGMKGYGSMRGNLEMSGEEFFLVVSGAGTRHQVTFILEGKNAKGLKKHLGHTLVITGTIEKSTGWGGRVQLDSFEPRLTEFKGVSRDGLEISTVENIGSDKPVVDVKLNHGLVVRLPERAGYTWAVEPTTAKRVGLREANYEPASGGPGTREFFFTPRNPGTWDVEFFLAKALAPAQVTKNAVMTVNVKP
ncbi:MAG: protease inhibitor I42 family protein [Myxococcaceae bacterium]